MELHLRGESVEAKQGGKTIVHIPLLNLEGIISFSYIPATPALMAVCAERQIAFSVLNHQGKLRYRVEGRTRGNPELRLRQFQVFTQNDQAFAFASEMISAKIHNSRMIIAKHLQNHREKEEHLRPLMERLSLYREQIALCDSPDILRGIEGLAAKTYYEAFSYMNLSEDPRMEFDVRSKHPPENAFNAMLSLSYTLLTTLCISALETIGIDPYFGVFHTVKSGKPALALDMMEELRAPMADRFVLRAINLGIIKARDFNADFTLSKTGMKSFLSEWDKMRSREILPSGSDEKIPLGLLPFYQAQLLARVLYGQNEKYCPYQMENS